MDPRLYNTIYLAVESGKVWKTTDRGKSWREITGNLSVYKIYTMCLIVNPADDLYAEPLIFIGSDAGVYTLLSNSSWAPFNKGLPLTCVRDLQYIPRSQTLAAGLYGRGIYYDDLCFDTRPKIAITSRNPAACDPVQPTEGSSVKFGFDVPNEPCHANQNYTVQWNVTGASLVSGETGNKHNFSIIAPDPSVDVMVTLTLTFNDGVSVSSSYGFNSITAVEAEIEKLLCSFKTRFKPQRWKMGDPAEISRTIQFIEGNIVLLKRNINTLHTISRDLKRKLNTRLLHN